MSCSDDDLPLAARARGPTAGNESDSDDDVPLSARVPSVTTTKPKPKNKNNSGGNKLAHKRKSSATEDYSSGDDEPIGSLVGIRNGKSSRPQGRSTKKKVKRVDDEPWREKKGAKKMWSSLEHNGVVFPPPYEAHGIPLVYDGHDVKLLPHEEEVATFFAVMKDTDYAQKDIFVKNFFDGFKKTLRGGPHGFIKDFKKCDFTKIYMWNLQERERKKWSA
jgi:DNA topoisomerase-1